MLFAPMWLRKHLTLSHFSTSASPQASSRKLQAPAARSAPRASGWRPAAPWAESLRSPPAAPSERLRKAQRLRILKAPAQSTRHRSLSNAFASFSIISFLGLTMLPKATYTMGAVSSLKSHSRSSEAMGASVASKFSRSRCRRPPSSGCGKGSRGLQKRTRSLKALKTRRSSLKLKLYISITLLHGL